MAKYKIDYHEKSGRFHLTYNGKLCSDYTIGGLMKNVRKEFGNGSYSLSRKARKAHG